MAREKTALEKPSVSQGYTDGGLNPLYEGLHDGETEQQRDERLAKAHAATKPIEPTRTRDRDPADREAWKRERAAALGIPRD